MVTAKQLRKLIDAQQYKCALTGIDLTPRAASLDHVVSLQQGGSNDLENVQIVHVCVNYCKRTLSNDQFINMCHAIARMHDDTGDGSWVDMMG